MHKTFAQPPGTITSELAGELRLGHVAGRRQATRGHCCLHRWQVPNTFVMTGSDTGLGHNCLEERQ